MHIFVTILAAAVGLIIAVVLTMVLAAFIASRDPDQSAGGAYFITGLMASCLTGPIGAAVLGYLVWKY